LQEREARWQARRVYCFDTMNEKSQKTQAMLFWTEKEKIRKDVAGQ
jgi:hypothetical protein